MKEETTRDRARERQRDAVKRWNVVGSGTHGSGKNEWTDHMKPGPGEGKIMKSPRSKKEKGRHGRSNRHARSNRRARVAPVSNWDVRKVAAA